VAVPVEESVEEPGCCPLLLEVVSVMVADILP
jgi:hypothetical protein